MMAWGNGIVGYALRRLVCRCGTGCAVAHRMVFIHEGSLIEEGSPAELVAGAKNPRTRRVLEAVL
jgi:ABC-type histidine transport system ATPase subunit